MVLIVVGTIANGAIAKEPVVAVLRTLVNATLGVHLRVEEENAK